MSFFDDEPDDEPTRVNRPARPRQAATRDTAAPADPDIIRRRQLILGGTGIVIALILLLGVKSCAGSRHRDSLKSYNQSVGDVIASSDTQVAPKLFELLSGDADGAQASAEMNRIRKLADDNAAEARGLDVPGDMTAAQRNLELVLNLRANAVGKIATNLPAAKTEGRGAVAAIRRISGEMQAFLASDVIYSQRVSPLIREALDDAGLEGTRVGSSRFLPTFGWLDFSQAAERINPDAGGAGTTPTGDPAPGRHGHGLTSTSIGGVALTTSGSPARVDVTSGMALDIKFQNQGENDEANVKVNVKVQPATGAAYTTSKVVTQTKAGEEASVSIPLTKAPARGSTARITVTVDKVPGEQTLDNNTATYNVFFN